MTPDMGPSRRQQYLQAQGQSPEDRIRALMQGLGGEVAGAADAAGDFIQNMPFKIGNVTPGPLLERGPYVPKPNDGPYIQEMQAPPKKNNNGGYGFLRQETDEEYARRKGRENGIE
jgi:hypothetical protein